MKYYEFCFAYHGNLQTVHLKGTTIVEVTEEFYFYLMCRQIPIPNAYSVTKLR